MPDLWMDVDAALSEVPVNIMPLLDDTDFKTREESVAFDAAGMDLVWNFVTTGGAYTQTAVTPTAAGNYDWASQGNGMYSIEIPASGGASINNDTEGFGWFTGVATGVLPWRGPTIGFRAAALNNAYIDGGDVPDVNVTEWLGTAAATPTIAGVPEVDITHLVGVAQSATDLKDFADDGYDPATNKVQGVVLTDTTTALTTNNDKTGYSLSAAAIQAIWDALTSALTTVGSIGKLLVDNINATISSRASQTSVDAIDDFVDTEVAAILEDTGTTIPAQISALNNLSAAQVNAEVDTALADINLDHLVGTATGIPAVPAGTYLDQVMDDGTAAFDRTTDSLQAIRDKAADIEADTNELQTDWVNGGRLDNILDARASQASVDTIDANVDAILVDTGTTLQAELDGIQEDTENIQTRIPTALTAGGNMKADALAINGSTTAAAQLAKSAATIVSGAAITGTLSTTQMTTDLTEATDDHYNGRIIIWTSGVLINQATDITDYNGATKMLTFTAVTEAPSAGDTFIIV